MLNLFAKRKRLDRVYLHIGFHKTGTSHIQQTLFRNTALLEKEGVSVICRDSYEREMDQGNAAYLLRLFERFHKKLKKSLPIAVISSEDMSWWQKEKVKELGEIIKQYTSRVKIIAYLRNHDEYAISMKQQGAKTLHIGKVYGHSEAVLPELTPEVLKRNAYSNSLQNWAEIFGKENISITTFDYLKTSGYDLVKDFFMEIDLPGFRFQEIPRQNESLDYYWQLFLHRHQSLWWANKTVRNAMLPEMIVLGNTGNKKSVSFQDRMNFREYFNEDIETLMSYPSSKIIFNKTIAEDRDFIFDETKYERVKQEFLSLQTKVTLSLFNDKNISKSEVEYIASEMSKVDKESAVNLLSLL